jgi:hypothetical protein
MKNKRWIKLLGAVAAGALTMACSAISGLDGLEVGGPGTSDDAGPGTPPGPGAPGDSGSVLDSGADTASPRVDSAVAVDSATSLDSAAMDSSAPAPDAQPANGSCVPLGVEPCAGQNENCVPDPNLPDADPLQPPSICIPIVGAGLGEGEPCGGSGDCAIGLDCIGAAGGAYACQWMCYDPLTAIIVPPPFDAGVLGSQPGRGGCPPLEVCTSVVNGYPDWLNVCTSGGM